MEKISTLALIWLVAALTACAPLRPPQEVSERLSRALQSADRYAAEGKKPEAFQLVSAVSAIDPEHEGLARFGDALTGEQQLFDRPFLGSNKSLRPVTQRSTAAKILLYFPDRVLDLMDVVSVSAHVGPGAFIDVHATRAVQTAAGLRSVAGVGLHEGRSIGLQTKAEAGLTVLAVGGLATSGATVGTSGVQSGSDGIFGLHSPKDKLYQEFRDYWALGASATVGLVGFDFDVHPVQLVDFLAGWLTIDFLHDDFAKTRGLKMANHDKAILTELADMRRSKKTMKAYTASKESGKPAEVAVNAEKQ